MSEQLQALITSTEADLAKVNELFEPLQKEHEQITEKIAPALDRLHAIENALDQLKPQKFKLEHQLEHLREINPDFDLHQRAKKRDGETTVGETNPPADETPPAANEAVAAPGETAAATVEKPPAT